MDPIFTANDQLELIDTNKSFGLLFGYQPNELNGLPIQQLFQHAEDFEVLQSLVKEGLAVDEEEYFMVTKSGETRPSVINCVSFEDEALGHRIVLGVIRDVTKRKLAERGILRAEKLAVTGKIARSIAHEVRNPLTNLTLALDQLRDELPDEYEDADLYFNIIQRNADRIGKLITDLLNSSKPRALERRSHTVNELLRSSIDLVSDRIKLQEMGMTIDLQDDSVHCQLDADQFQVAIVNLLVNAIEAMRPREGHLTVKSYQKADCMYVTIQDNGRGIAPENLNQLFEPFYTAKKEGTGLGLTTVQNIINSHGGEIDVVSEIQQGTAFTISLHL
jgi:PAS domain S-box-containing protein